ncbi:MAG: putative ABC transport system ATP-binding protein [Cyclobacteriaceae bacterium]|jgi:putative ABC transport system ATP-binding protein
MQVIETNNVVKVYNQDHLPVKAVDGISLSIAPGEFTAIVGPSGCGKTTLLNLIGGLDHPTAGNVTVSGVHIDTLKESELTDFRLQNIGFVFQSYNLIPVLTAKENIEFIMLLQHKDKRQRDMRVNELMAKMGLSETLNRKPSELSGGQQQRVAVARALASKPKVILADEPTANLDSKSTEDLLDIMAKLNSEEEVTFVFSTHDQRVIDKARRIITLEDGKVISDEAQ